VLSGYVDGDVVRYTELLAGLRYLVMTVVRTADVLAAMEFLLDDRRDGFEGWLAGEFDALAPASPPRPNAGPGCCTTEDRAPGSAPSQTVWQYMANARPRVRETVPTDRRHGREVPISDRAGRERG